MNHNRNPRASTEDLFVIDTMSETAEQVEHPPPDDGIRPDDSVSISGRSMTSRSSKSSILSIRAMNMRN